MASNFVPLQASVPLPTATRRGHPEEPQVLSGTAAVTLSSALVIPGTGAVPQVPTPASLFSPLRPEKTACVPQLRLQREGDRITMIHIQCSCGQAIELSCVY